MTIEGEGAAPFVAVVIPCFRVVDHIQDVLSQIGDEVSRIYVVDDKCPDGSGKVAEAACANDARIRVIYHESNQGVGGATLTGMAAALDDEADVIVKIDGDGQMDPNLIPAFVALIVSGHTDYAKGNRFYDVASVRSMPKMRLIGNAALSFLAKLSTGYWQVFDPNNGFVAIHGQVAKLLPMDKIAKGYFFETDMLFRLNILQAHVLDVPMDAVYGNETSNVRIGRESVLFARGHMRNTFKRLFYNYYLRNFSAASLEILLAAVGLTFGLVYGSIKWWEAIATGEQTPSGTVMLAALPVIVGFQALLAFINHDISSTPQTPLHKRLYMRPKRQSSETKSKAKVG